MRILLTIIIAALAVASCKDKTTTTKEHLPPDVMRQVMLDINLAESYSINVKDSLHKGGTKNYDSLAVYYKDIFAHYKITEAQFTQSLNWYKEHPDEMDSLFTKMIPVITKWQSEPGKAK